MKVVVVGGGFGGIKTALELSVDPNISVTIISNSSNFEYNAALYRTATGRSPMEVAIPIKEIFKNCKNVNFIIDEMEKIDVPGKRIISKIGTDYKYDLAVLAIGQTINYFGIPGMQEFAHSMDSVKSTILLRERLKEVVLSSALKQPHFVVIGAGPSGIELSAELNTFAKDIAKKFNTEEKEFRVTLIEGSDRVLPTFHPKISKKVHERLEKLGVEVRLNCKVTEARANAVYVENRPISTNTIVWTAGFQNNKFFSDNDHIFRLSKNKKVEVDEHMQATKAIYVIGDNANTKFSGMAQTALHDAEYVANDILNQQYERSRKKYKPKQPLYVVPVGDNYAVFDSRYVHLYGYPAWILRRMADFRLYNNFEPLKNAIKTWRMGGQMARDY